MKVLVTGAKGQLGYDVCERLVLEGIEHTGVDRDDFDLTDAAQVRKAFEMHSPTVVIHCAAYTAVDKAETELYDCQKANVDATLNIAMSCKQYGASLLYISTDYVFSGDGIMPFQTSEPYGPRNAYGRTKAEGELIVRQLLEHFFIVRISWVFGMNGNNFVKSMQRLGGEKSELRVVADQVGSPTYTYDLAILLAKMIRTEKYGIYHATNEGFCSWAEFAEVIMEFSGLECRVIPISTVDYATPAKRPLNSRLSKASLAQSGFDKLPPWQDALARYIESSRS